MASRSSVVTIGRQTTCEPTQQRASGRSLLPLLAAAALALLVRERLVRHPLAVREMWSAVMTFLRANQRIWLPGLPVEARPTILLVLRTLMRVIGALSGINRAVERGLTRAETSLQRMQ